MSTILQLFYANTGKVNY